MRLRLFGRPQLTLDDGRGLAFLPERRFRLLAYLAVTGSWVTRTRLAALFWPEHEPSSARTNLRKLLLEVRQLGLPNLEEAETGLRWCPSTDLAEFEAAVAAQAWDRATALVQGPPLDGVESGPVSPAFEAWLQYERARILTPWRRGVLAALEQADPGTGVPWCRVLLKVDPLDEDAMAAWLRLGLAAEGRQEAIDAFRGYRHRLVESLGIEPSTRLQQLSAAYQRPMGGARPLGSVAEMLLGREPELVRLAARLADPQCRLLTLVGPGGVGKTSVARRLAQDWAASGRPVWWVPLEDVLTPSALVGRIADEVMPGLPLPGQALSHLARHWPGGPGLLVLDAFEHLVDAAEHLVALLQAAPALRILITSRERLDVAAEWLVPLASMGAPPSGASMDEVLRHPAVQLFDQRARRVQPEFELAAEWQAVRGICAATDGLPLALELAAGWVRLMPCRHIERDLAAGLAWIDDNSHTLARSFEHSWSLLTPAERDAFCRLAVFRGGFTREAAAQVADVPLPLLASLADKSMLRREGPARLSLHALLHEYAMQQLRRDPAALASLRDRHGRWALAHLRHHYGLVDGQHATKCAALAAERANLLQAWSHWVANAARPELDLAAEVLAWFHVAEGRPQEAIELFAQAADALRDDTPEGAALRAHQAWLELWMERYAQAIAMAQRVLPVLESSRHEAGTLLSLRTLAHAARRQGRHADSAKLFDDALRLARRIGDARQVATMIDARAMAAIMLGEYALAIESLHEATALNEQVGNDVQRMYNDFNLSQAHAFGGDAQAALVYADAAVERTGRIGYRIFEPYVHCQRAAVLQALGRHDLADGDLRRADDVAHATSVHTARVWAMELHARSALARGEPGAARALLREAAALASETGNVMMGAALVPVAARTAQALGDPERAGRWLRGLLDSGLTQAPVLAEARALLREAAPAQGPAPGLQTTLLEIASVR